MSRRRLGNLAVFLAVGAVASAMGYVPWEVPALLVPWIGAVWLAGSAMSRASSPAAAQTIETASYCLDAVWLTGVCFYLGGADWIASAFYVLLAITAAASLPWRKAALVVVLAWAGFASLSVGEAVGAIHPREFGPVTSGGELPFAALTILIQATTLVLAVLLQQALLSALRRSEARHRAILSAASDMVVVLDREGKVQGASGVFAERTAFPIRGLVGGSFADIVDARHRESFAGNLEAACTGEHSPFEIAYRSSSANQGWIAGTLVPLPPENGEERVLMIARDVSAEHRTVTAREAVLASEVASARLAALDGAVREVVRDVDLRLRRVLHEVGTTTPTLEDDRAQATLLAVGEELKEARSRTHELVSRLDKFRHARGQGVEARMKSSA